MTATEPQSDIDTGGPSPDFTDAFEIGATAVACGIAGALCTGFTWRLCGRIFCALVGADEERLKAPPARLPYAVAEIGRRQPLRLALGEGGAQRGSDEESD